VVHLLRDLTYLAQEQSLAWTAELIGLLLDMKAACDLARAQGDRLVASPEVADWQAHVAAIVAQADATTQYVQAPHEHNGRVKQSAARNLLDRLRAEQEAVLAFLHRLDIPFDNIQAERDVRMVKVQQKVSSSLRSQAGTSAFCRIRGYLSTLRKQGLHLLGPWRPPCGAILSYLLSRIRAYLRIYRQF
jgi:transposase